MVRRQIDAAGLLGDELSFADPVELPADAMADDEHALGAVKGDAVLVSFLHVRRPDALFEDKPASSAFLDVVFADGILGVGQLLVVVEEVLAAQAGDSVRVAGDSKSPEGDIDIMNAVVANVAAAEVVPPTPDAR